MGDVDNKMQSTWKSRRETLSIMFSRVLDAAEELGYYNAIVYTSPLTQLLLDAMEEYRHQRDFGAINEAQNIIDKRPPTTMNQ